MYAKQSSKQRIKRAGWSLALIGSMVLSPLSSYAAVYDLNDNKDGIVGKEVKKDASETKPESKNDAAKSETKSETTRVIEMLEERVRMLEEKIAQFTGGAKTPATATSGEAVKPSTGNYAVSVPTITPAAATTTKAETTTTAAAQDPKPDPNAGVLNFFKDVEVSGIVDGYYGYNSNKVDMFTQGRAFDVRHNAFSLQLASVRLERKNSKDNPLGFRVDLGVGETVDRIISVSDSSRNDATKHVLQAYASYVAPVGTGLTLDFGKFYTPIGAEVIESKDNFNYTRGWLFTYGPYYHAGVRAKYAVNDKVALAGFLVNGWDNLFENNVKTGKSGGFQIALTPNKKFALTETYLVGKEAPLANVPAVSLRDNVRHAADTVATVYVTDKFTLLGNMIFGSDGDNAGKRGSWQGFAGYFKYAFNGNLAFSPRFEVLRDRDGLRTGASQTVKDITLTQEVKLKDNFITRFEFRRDFSDANFFTNSRGVGKDSQNTFTIGVSYFFTTKGQ